MATSHPAGLKGSRHKARRSAVQALYQWQLTQQAPCDIESHFILDHTMDDVDVDYFHQLVREVPLHQHELDDHLVPHLDRNIADVDPVERAILRIGAYELEFHPEIPYKVVVNEAVELAKEFGSDNASRFINGVLGAVAASEKELRAALKEGQQP